MAPTHLASHNKRILVLDGGGIRGLGALLVIDSIMKAVEFRARKKLLPCEVFDLMSGTSTGGVIAILLGRLGLDCVTAIKVYKELATSVCGTDEQAFWEKLLKSLDADVEPKALEVALVGILQKYTGSADAFLASSDRNADIVDHESTDTFITVTSDAPTYNNRTHCIRSYPTQLRAPPPSGHKWLIREAFRGTIASRIFMSPMFISKYGYRDASFSGFSSPVNFIQREINELWPRDKISIIVSIGSGLTSLAPPNPRRDWAITEPYAEPLVAQVIDKLPLTERSSDVMKLNATIVVKQFVTLAVDTEISQAEIVKAFPAQGTYARVNPSLGIANTDLADCFHADVVETTVRKWLQGEGKQYIADIATRLVDLNEQPLTIDQARALVPPPPPNTNPGYNPQLDERRPETMLEYLKNYHVFFVVDDSGSMRGARWAETKDALLEIADHALAQNVDEIDVMFFNNRAVYQGVKGAAIIEQIFTDVVPSGATPTGATLQKVLEEHISKLDRAVNTREYSSIRPLDIIVLTDGVPTDDPKAVLVDAVARMKIAKHHPNAVGVQIVQIGDEADAIPVLQGLMYGEVGNIVDTVPYNGTLTPDRLERILLGGLHPNLRGLIAP